MKRTFGTPALLALALLLSGQGGSPVVAPRPIAAPAGLSPDTIMRAEQNLHFDGTLLIDGKQKVRVQQEGADRQRQEYLGPNGELTDLVVSDGQIRWHWMPRLNTVNVSPTEPDRETVDQRIALLRKNYRFQVLGQARQAGRVVLLTRFTPIHRGNPIHRLWIDLETHLPLVVERRTEAGDLLDRSEYTSIDYKASFDAQTFGFRIPEGARVESPSTVLAHGSGDTPRPKGLPFQPEPPREMPQGYTLLSWRYFLGNTHVPTFNWRFHDGLNMLSLFAIDERQAAKLPPSARQIPAGPPNTWLLERHGERLLTWYAHGVNYTLVGDLPTDDLVEVARSTL